MRPNLIHRPQHYPQRFKDSMGDILEAHLFACLRLGDWALDVQPAIALLVQKAWKQLLSPFHQGVTLISSNSTLGWLDLGDSHVGWRGEVTSDRSRCATQLWGRAPGWVINDALNWRGQARWNYKAFQRPDRFMRSRALFPLNLREIIGLLHGTDTGHL